MIYWQLSQKKKKNALFTKNMNITNVPVMTWIMLTETVKTDEQTYYFIMLLKNMFTMVIVANKIVLFILQALHYLLSHNKFVIKFINS